MFGEGPPSLKRATVPGNVDRFLDSTSNAGDDHRSSKRYLTRRRLNMPKRLKEVDQYIADSPEFARPILKTIRRLIHKACPQIQESIKWSSPCFEYHGIVASMAAFKKHVRLAFWKGQHVKGSEELCEEMTRTGMSAMKLHSMEDLPDHDALSAFMTSAAALNEPGDKPVTARKQAARRSKPKLPDDLLARLKKHKKARATFDGFSPSHQREYVEWITEAKRAATRQRRIDTTIEWLTEGKTRNWKYR